MNTAYEDDNYKVIVEPTQVGWVLHCYVTNWSKTVYDSMLHLIGVLKELAPNNELFAMPPNSKAVKFAHMLGFQGGRYLLDDEGNRLKEVLWV